VFRDAAGEDRDRRVWQPTRHAEAIETERFWQQKFDYVHENPCRKGLVIRAQDWRFSSAAYWISDGASRSDVPLTAIAW
jgi:putative transposase